MEVKKNDTNTVKSKPVKLKAKGRSLTGQPLDDIDLNPQLDTTDKKQVNEQSRGGVVLTFGRMNPPTVGHEKLVKKVVAVAAQAKATPMVFLSHSQDKKKNPLDYEDKIRFAKAAFGNVVQASPAKNLIDILKTLQSKFKELTLVVGSDRVSEFQTLLNKYNGKEFTFDKINVVSAGERDPDAEGVEGMSASKMRAAVQDGDDRKFISGLPQRLKPHGKEVFKMVSAGMQLHEELEQENLLSEVLSIDQRRKRAIIMRRYSAKIARARELAKKRMATGDKLKKRAFIQARGIVRGLVAGRRGAEYEKLSASEKMQVDTAVQKKKAIVKKIAGRLMPQVKAAEFARLKSFTQGAPMQHMHSGPSAQHEEFNQLFEQFSSSVEIVTVDDILKEMTQLVLDKIITEKQIRALEKRSQKSGVQFDLLEQVYVRGLLETMGDEQAAFNRVNAFVCGGKTAMNEDFDLYQQVERKDLNEQFDENFMDGKGPGRPGDAARHGLKGKSSAELKKIRSSDSASPRKKQLAHFMLNMTKNESTDINEDLRKWFDQKWVRMDTKGEIKGDCAREEGEGKPKCLPQAKAHAMDKEDRAKAARRKRREDPVADRSGKGGKPVNVRTEEYIIEKSSPTNPTLWSRAKALARQKFDVYPSAYANGWAAKWYKSKGGGWKSVNESVSLNTDHYKALTDIELNTKNRDMTTKNDGYGPLNPLDEKGSAEFWDDKADMWNTTVEAAKEARCGNCAFFNQSPPVMKKIADGIGVRGETVSDLAGFGFCELWEFKCADLRTCNTWVLGGPITEQKGTEARRKIEKVDRKAPHTEHGKQQEIQKKIIDEEGNCEPDPKKRLQGTDSLVKAYKKDTPGEKLDESFNIAYAAGIGVTLTAADVGIKARGGFALHPSVIQQMEEEEDFVDEAVKAADKAPVVVPSHTDQHGNVIPAKTVMRKKGKVIVNPGDNPSDGQ